MRALVLAALVACGGGGAAKPVAPTPVEKPAPAAPVSAELTGAIKKVRVDGAGSVSAAVEAAVRDLAGKQLDPDQIRAALVTAMATPGVADVTVKGVQLADGIDLVVEVTLHPPLKKLTATEPGGKTIALGMQAIPTGTLLDPKKVQALAMSLRDRYISNGYYAADVTWRRVAMADGVEVVLDVKPGEASSIASVGFKGNTVPSKTLVSQLTKWLVVGEPVLAEKLQGAALTLEAYYWDRGHANVKVRAPEVTPGKIALVFEIDEGPKFKIGTIKITGDVPAADHAKHLKVFGVKKGDLFSRTAIVDGRKRVVEALIAAGKPTAEVVPLTNVDLGAKTIGLTLEVSAK